MNIKTTIVALAILLSVVLLSTIGYYILIESKSDEKPSKIYGIVIDGGSTGTRLLGFEFKRNNSELILGKELWKQYKPGLSSLTPFEAQQQIRKLLDHAEKFVPENLWKKTSLQLKATAGFRLIDANKSAEILNAIREVFKSSKFLVNDTNYSVEIINGDDEGIFSWLSTNYLRNLLNTDNKVAILDLGGGSTQVAFEIDDDFPEHLRKFSKKLNENLKVFTKSFLGLGLNALRQSVVTKDADQSERSIESVCMHPDTPSFEYKYQNLIYQISPKISENSTFEDCWTDVSTIVDDMRILKIPDLQNQTINAFSYFFDRLYDAGIVKDEEGEEIPVEIFRKKAIEYCEDATGSDPWFCLDFTYMSVLLQNEYELADDKTITVFSKINGHETNWALGSFLHDYLMKN